MVLRHLESMAMRRLSTSTASGATKQLDTTLATWRTGRIEGQAYPQRVIDAHYERVRGEGQVRSTAALWVMGVPTINVRNIVPSRQAA